MSPHKNPIAIKYLNYAEIELYGVIKKDYFRSWWSS